MRTVDKRLSAQKRAVWTEQLATTYNFDVKLFLPFRVQSLLLDIALEDFRTVENKLNVRIRVSISIGGHEVLSIFQRHRQHTHICSEHKLTISKGQRPNRSSFSADLLLMLSRGSRVMATGMYRHWIQTVLLWPPSRSSRTNS